MTVAASRSRSLVHERVRVGDAVAQVRVALIDTGVDKSDANAGAL